MHSGEATLQQCYLLLKARVELGLGSAGVERREGAIIGLGLGFPAVLREERGVVSVTTVVYYRNEGSIGLSLCWR